MIIIIIIIIIIINCFLCVFWSFDRFVLVV